jgi:hypothetical protein
MNLHLFYVVSGKRGHIYYAQAFEDIALIASKADPNLPHFLFGMPNGISVLY